MEDHDKFEFEMMKAQLDAAQRDNAVLAQRLAALETKLATVQMTVDDLQVKSTDATDESQVVAGTPAPDPETFTDLTQMVDPDNAATEQELFKDAQNGVKERRSTEWSPDAVGGGPLGLHKFTELAEHKLVLSAEENAGSGSQSGCSTVTVKLEVDNKQELPQGKSTGPTSEEYAVAIRRRTEDGYVLEWARPGGQFTMRIPRCDAGSDSDSDSDGDEPSGSSCYPRYYLEKEGNCTILLKRQNRAPTVLGDDCEDVGTPTTVSTIDMSSCSGGGGSIVTETKCVCTGITVSASGVTFTRENVLVVAGAQAGNCESVTIPFTACENS